jgi:TolA-binding protein
VNNEQQTQQADDPSGDGWRDVEPDEILQHGDMYPIRDHWEPTASVGAKARVCGNGYRRRIEPQQASDSDSETMEQLREQVRDLTRQAQFDAVELQRLKDQVQTLTRERDRYRNQLEGAIEHSKAPEAQAQLVDRLQTWLRPVLEVVSDHPDHASILAVSVMEFLPQIASRLIEE